MSVVDVSTGTDVERLRQRHLAEARGTLSEHLERITWSAERIGSEWRSRLRNLTRIREYGSS